MIVDASFLGLLILTAAHLPIVSGLGPHERIRPRQFSFPILNGTGTALSSSSLPEPKEPLRDDASQGTANTGPGHSTGSQESSLESSSSLSSQNSVSPPSSLSLSLPSSTSSPRTSSSPSSSSATPLNICKANQPSSIATTTRTLVWMYEDEEDSGKQYFMTEVITETQTPSPSDEAPCQTPPPTLDCDPNAEPAHPANGTSNDAACDARLPQVTTDGSLRISTDIDGEECTQVAVGETVTVVEVVYNETITFTGPSSDYTPEFPTITVPVYCETNYFTTESEPLMKPNFAIGTKQLLSACTYGENEIETCKIEALFNPPLIFSVPYIPSAGVDAAPNPVMATETYYATEKNPSVVFVDPNTIPDYGNTQPPIQAATNGPIAQRPPQSVELPETSFTIRADANTVVINGLTIANVGPGQTSTVSVDGGLFAIDQSRVVQLPGGQIVTRPSPNGGLYVPEPMVTNAAGLDISVSGPYAIIDGFTYSIGATPNTEVIKGQTVVIGPSGIVLPSSGRTVSFKAESPEQTGVVVVGGEFMTAVGQSIVVIRSTTLTYGPGQPERTETIDDDIIVIGPSGVIAHGTTLGGPGAQSTTKLVMVGGATLTQIGPSRLVIRGATFTVGPGTGTTTTEAGGETITIRPEGVTISTLTLPFPFGPTVVTTLKPVATATSGPEETALLGEEEDSAIVARPAWRILSLGFCIAIGVLGF